MKITKDLLLVKITHIKPQKESELWEIGVVSDKEFNNGMVIPSYKSCYINKYYVVTKAMYALENQKNVFIETQYDHKNDILNISNINFPNQNDENDYEIYKEFKSSNERETYNPFKAVSKNSYYGDIISINKELNQTDGPWYLKIKKPHFPYDTTSFIVEDSVVAQKALTLLEIKPEAHGVSVEYEVNLTSLKVIKITSAEPEVEEKYNKLIDKKYQEELALEIEYKKIEVEKQKEKIRQEALELKETNLENKIKSRL